MAPRRKLRADGSPAHRSRRTPRPAPSAEALATLERLTAGLPPELQAYRELLSAKRRYYLEEALRHRTRSLVPVLAGAHDPHNQAAVLRTCDALGIQEVHVVRAERTPFRPSSRITQNAHRWLDLLFYDDFEAAAAALRGRGLTLLAAAMGRAASPLYALDFTRPTALIFGGEASGLPREILAACDGTFVIPMYGLSQSLNLSVAAAVALSAAVEARRQAWGQPGDLSEAERLELRRRFYATAARGRTPQDPPL